MKFIKKIPVLFILIITFLYNCIESQSAQILGFGTVKNAIYSPDGTKIASCGDGGIFIWNTFSGDTVLSIRNNAGSVTSIDFNPDGSSIASCSGATIKIWDLVSGANTVTFQAERRILNIKYSEDGNRLAYGCNNGTIGVFDVNENKLITSFSCSIGSLYSICFSPNINKAVTTSEGSKFQTVLTVWDLNTGKSLYQKIRFNGEILMDFSYDESMLAYVFGKTIFVCNPSNGDLITTINSPRDVHNIDFSRNGKYLVSSYHDVINIKDEITKWNLETGDTVWNYSINSYYSSNYKSTVQFSPDDNTIVSSFSGNPVTILDAAKGYMVNTLLGHTCGIQGISFSPDGNYIISGGEDGSIRVWDLNSEKIVSTIDSNTTWITDVEFSKDGNTVLLSSGVMIKAYDFKTGTKLMEKQAHNDVIWDIEYSPDSKNFATCSNDGLIRIWNSVSGDLNQTINGNNGVTHSINYFWDENKLLSGGWGRLIKIWDLSTYQELNSFVGSDQWIDFVKISPDGKHIASVARDNTLKIWDTNTSKLIKSLKFEDQSFGCPNFSPSSEFLACGTSGGKVIIWNKINFSINKVLAANNLGASRVIFSNDGKRFASSGKEGTIFIWDIEEILNVQAETSSFISSISISPNPATEFIEVFVPDELNQGFNSLFQDKGIYDVFGELILSNSQFSIQNSRLIADISSFPPGVYLVRAGGKAGKFVKY